MFRPILRSALRQSAATRNPTLLRPQISRRALSTSTDAAKGRGAKATLLRFLLVTGGLYYVSNTDYFADGLNSYNYRRRPSEPTPEEKAAAEEEEDDNAPRDLDLKKLAQEAKEREKKVKAEVATVAAGTTKEGSAQELENEAGQEGAFNPETGEINWDCPCLGGMAHGPCGPEFREAFSCFVYSKEEPKGVECIEKFSAMQKCFKEHPEVYGEELQSEDEDEKEIDDKLEAMEAKKDEKEGEKKEQTGVIARLDEAKTVQDSKEALDATENYISNGGIEPKLEEIEAKVEEEKVEADTVKTDGLQSKIKEIEEKVEEKIPTEAVHSKSSSKESGTPPKKDDIAVEEHKN